MRVLVDNLGEFNPDEMSFITSEKGLKYVELLNDVAPKKEEAPLCKLLNMKDSTLRDIPRPMVEVNPYFRPTARELLKHTYFDEVRISEYERFIPVKLSLEIDHDELKDPNTMEF